MLFMIKKEIKIFLESRKYEDRYSSFDFCYSYFYKFYKNGAISKLANDDNIENSCLHIWFYLASWWMMRWSSFLLQNSMGSLKKLVIKISELDTDIWEIDVNTYTEENIKKILKVYTSIENIFIQAWHKPSQTLITKIMLWVFGVSPAFDRYFRKWMGVYSFNEKNLTKIHKFYIENKKEIDSIQINCYNFLTEKDDGYQYTKAKIIDMYAFTKWFNSM